MKRPAVFFDRDNTLIACDGNSDGYLGDPAAVRLVPGAAEALARARGMGYATVVVSNQGGVARGMFDEAAVRAVNDRLDELLREADPRAVIERHEYCPYDPDGTVPAYRADSELRKPKPGMLLAAAAAMGLDLKRSWMIGDAPRDVEAGRAAGCRAILCRDPAAPSPPDGARADETVTSLRAALDFIEAHPPAHAGERPAGAVVPGSQAAAKPQAGKAAPVVAPAVPRGTAAVAGKPVAVPAPLGARSPVAVKPSVPPAVAKPTDAASGTSRLEFLAEQILLEVRRRNEQHVTEFSVSKLMAGMVQVIVFAVLFLGYLRSRDGTQLQTYLMVATMLQTLTISLLIMGRQR